MSIGKVLKELGDIIASFQDLSGDNPEDRADYYLDRLEPVEDALIKETANLIYQNEGADGVYDFANEIGITKWSECSGCNAETPSYDGECLVCGQAKKD